MQQMTSSRAKQNFGELLEAVTLGPVAIERHKKIKAIVCSPEAFQAQSGAGQALAERRVARADQVLVEKNRLIKHQKWAIELLVMPQVAREALMQQARAEVAKWRRDGLCSSDYADRWDDLLKLPVADLAQAMASEALDWGTALRQNSPWHVLLPA
jgi:PHD/YefM family antitoxin component YafN of YafNO toxin-antitoxin module